MPLVISNRQLHKDKKLSDREEKGRNRIFSRLKKIIYPPSLPMPIRPETMESSMAASREGRFSSVKDAARKADTGADVCSGSRKGGGLRHSKAVHHT